MSELRQDRTSGRWTIIAPKRSRRPLARHRALDVATGFPVVCPFCPGHEAELPGIIAETADGATASWKVRVVPNKFPALRKDRPPDDVIHRNHQYRSGFGIHEVVIEGPQHDTDLPDMAESDLLAVATMYRERCRALIATPGIEAIVLFRNHGARAGASQDHPHSQIVALGLAPPRAKELAAAGLAHFEQFGSCATCEEIEVERRNGTRIVEESRHFVTVVPFAAEHPFETWLLPDRHKASFSEMDDAELVDFSAMLGRTLKRIERATVGAPYRFVVESASRGDFAAPHLHWHLRIVPQLVTWGGFELGAGMAINPSCPEEDATVLRSAGGGIEDRR